jgi:serine/threonine protein phosphatase PrpC
VIAAGDGSGVLVVADGCGGMARGEQAARLAIETWPSRRRRRLRARDSHCHP